MVTDLIEVIDAFDKSDHDVLIECLSRTYRVHSTALDWFPLCSYSALLGELAASLGLSSHFYADDSHLYTWGHLSTVGQQWRHMELGVERFADQMWSN